MDIGFIGLGSMGSGMASNLLKAGHQVTVYNRTASKAKPLVAAGAQAARSVAEACGGQAVVTMLADDDAVEGVAFGAEGLVARLRPGALHMSSSTIGAALAERLAKAHAAAGQLFVSAPVFGRPEAAAAGKLFVVAAGEKPALDAASALFAAIGQRTFVVSDRPEAANLVKLSGNFMIASAIEALSEAMALVEKGGVDPRLFVDVLTSTLFDAPIYKTYGDLLVRRAFEPAGFAAPLGYKDVRLTLAAGDALRVPMPLASLLREQFLRLLAHGGDRLDWSALGQVAAEGAGLRRG